MMPITRAANQLTALSQSSERKTNADLYRNLAR